LKPVIKIAVLLLLLPQPWLAAQQADETSVVTEDKIVVEAAPQLEVATGADQPAGGGIQPAADRTWGSMVSRVANLQVESSGTSSFGSVFSLRGLANTPYFSDSAVALYFDDIPLGSSFTYPTDLFGFASASVYLGPQGTLFGRAGEGGVIALRLPEPGAAGSGELLLGKGDYDANSVAFQAGGELGSRADGTVAAAYTERDGAVDNTQIMQRVGDERALSALARTRFRPTATSEISAEILEARHRDGAQPLVPLGGPLYTVQRAREGETDTDMTGAAVKAAFDTGAGRLTSVTSYTDWRLDPYEDWLVLPPPLNSYLTQSQETWGEEAHLNSGTGAGLAWNLGTWLSESKTIGAADRSILGLIPIEESDYDSTAYDAALFGQVLAAPAPGWQASFGVRLEYAAKDYHQDEQVPTYGLHFHFLDSNDFFLPKVAVSHELAPGTTAEATVSFGSKPGGFSPYTDKPPLIPFAAERTAAIEAGVTSEFARKAASLTARVFGYAIENYQIEQSFSATDYLVATAPRARSLGGEIEAQVHPLRGWTIDASGGITDATLLRFDDPLTGASYAGHRAPYAPAYTADLGVGYRAARGLFGRAELVAKGRTFYTESEDPAYAQGAYTLLGARVGYDARRWRLTLYLDNIAGRRYYSQIIPGVNSAAPGLPRTAGSELAIKF
jgi:iron complex outermembrane receptor protein